MLTFIMKEKRENIKKRMLRNKILEEYAVKSSQLSTAMFNNENALFWEMV